jgi:hypothetical protein
VGATLRRDAARLRADDFSIFYIFFKFILQNYTTISNFSDLATNRRGEPPWVLNAVTHGRLEAGHGGWKRPTTVGPNCRGPRRVE